MSSLPKIGLDIGAASIKLAELAPAGKGKWKLLTAATMPNPDPRMGEGRISTAAAAGIVAKMAKEAGVRSRRAVAAISESAAYTHVVEMPILAEGEIEQALSWQVEQYIPLPRDQAVWSWEVMKRDEVAGAMEVMLVAIPRSLAQWYREMIEAAGMEPVGLETEMAAVARAVTDASSPLTVVVDVGARSTDMAVVRSGQLVFSRTIPTAGEAFTRAVEQVLGLDSGQAERYKSTYGFEKDQLEGKLAGVMQPVLTLIAAEVKKTIDFYNGKHGETTVTAITLCGGVAAMPGVVTPLSTLLGMEVVVGNPFAKVALDEAQKKELTGMEPFYSTVVGLAMKEV